MNNYNLTFVYQVIQGKYPQKYKFDFNLQNYIQNAVENDLFHKFAVWSYINEQEENVLKKELS